MTNGAAKKTPNNSSRGNEIKNCFFFVCCLAKTLRTATATRSGHGQEAGLTAKHGQPSQASKQAHKPTGDFLDVKHVRPLPLCSLKYSIKLAKNKLKHHDMQGDIGSHWSCASTEILSLSSRCAHTSTATM
jgi:hypothetical protein